MKIVVIDDHPVVRRGIISILEEERDFDIRGEADEGNAALKLVSDAMPDIAIIDIQLKGNIDGIELVKAIHERYLRVLSLVMSVNDGVIYAERAIKAGARGFLAKNEASEEIVKAIRTIAAGSIYLCSEISAVYASKYIMGASHKTDFPITQLSNRELEIFKLIGKGFKRKEIAKKLNINIYTIESHRKKIRQKLNLEDTSALAKVAIQWNVENS